MKTPEDLEKLSSLLDDEDDDVAINVIAALLDRQDELGDLPARLQESCDPLVRRRAHQLQAAMTFRRRRREFFQLLSSPEPDFLHGLTALQLLWFDRDVAGEVEKELFDFVANARKKELVTLEDARAFMCGNGFAAELETTLRPEIYCIGLVLSQRIGAASLLMGLLRMLMREPEKFQVVRFCGEFALFDRKNTILLGQGDWRVCRISSVSDLEHFSLRDILHCAGNMLFSSAVNSDSFRYVLTIAQAISGDDSDRVLSACPYPYNSAAPEQK